MSSEYNIPQDEMAEDTINTATPETSETQYDQAEITPAEEEQPVSEYEAAEATPPQVQEQQPSMSPEHTLLLQVLRRAKRQQDLIQQVQKSLKALASIEKTLGRTGEQVKQLQSALKDNQKQIGQMRRQVEALERAQKKGFEKVASRKIVVSAPAAKKTGKKKAKGKKSRR